MGPVTLPKGSEGSQTVLKARGPAGRDMAVVRGRTELSPAKKLASFMDNVLFPLPALPKREWVPPNASAIKALREARAANGTIHLVPKQTYF